MSSHYPGYTVNTNHQNGSQHQHPPQHLMHVDPMLQPPHQPQVTAQLAPQAYPGYYPHYATQHLVPAGPAVPMMAMTPGYNNHPHYAHGQAQVMATPPPPSQQQIAREWESIQLARQKLALLEEKIQLDQELLKQEKKQRRRQRQIATQELHAEWQQEMKLLQQRTLQIQEEYEAKLEAQKKESETLLEKAREQASKSLAPDPQKSRDDGSAEHDATIRELQKSLEEERKRVAEVEQKAKETKQRELQELQEKLANQQQNDIMTRQQQWLDKLHLQEQKQQERLEDLRRYLQRDYEVKCVKLQEDLEEKSIAERTSVESEYQQKLTAQLSEAHTEHEQQLTQLHKKLQQRDSTIQILELKEKESQEAAKGMESLMTQLAEKDAAIEELQHSLEDMKVNWDKERDVVSKPSSFQEQETKIKELEDLMKIREEEQAEALEALQSKLAEREAAVSRLENDLLEMAKQRDDQLGVQQVEIFTSLKNTLMDREHTIEKLNGLVKELEARDEGVETLQGALQQRDEMIQSLQAKIPELETEQNEKCSALEEKLATWAETLASKDETIHCLEEELSKQKEEHVESLQAREKSFKELQLVTADAVKCMESEVTSLERQLELARSTNDSKIQDLLDAKDTTINEMGRQIADLKQERDYLIITDMDSAMMKTRLNEKIEAVTRLEDRLREMEQKQEISADQQAKLAEKDEAISRLEAQLLEMERDLYGVKSSTCKSCPSLREEVAALQGKLHCIEAEKKHSSSDATEHLKLRKEMSQLLRKEEQFKSRIETQELEIKALNEMNEALQSNLGQGGPNKTGSIAHLRSLQRIQQQQNRKQVMEVFWKGSSTVDSGIFTGFLNDLRNPDGSGTLKFEDGSVYDGEWKDGNLHGEGVFAWVDGDTYHGEWVEGRQHGYGVFVWADGRLYQGNYKMGQRDGEGLMTWPYGARYKGLYKGDKRNGYGVYIYPDGRVYSGEYKDERPHGQGTETSADGNIVLTGEWSEGEFQQEHTVDI